MSETQGRGAGLKTLQFNRFYRRLFEIESSVSFSVTAICKHDESLKPIYGQLSDSMRSSINKSLAAVMPEGLDDGQMQQLINPVLQAFQLAVPSKALLLNLSLVMLCTEIEVFITHLVHVVLSADPRKLMNIASDKHITTEDVLQAGDYAAVLASLCEKVTDEITNCRTDKMFVHHLGKRLGLISEGELDPDSFLTPMGGRVGPHFRGWGKAELARVFQIRHDIVHQGTLPIEDAEFIERVASYFMYVETVLARNARQRFAVPIALSDLMALQVFCHIYGLSLDLGTKANVVNDIVEPSAAE